MINGLSYGNVRLRPLEPEDLDELYKWENDPSIWKVSCTQTPFSRYILKKYIEESHRDINETRQLRLIIENTEGKAVGAIDLFDYEPYHQRAGVGILIYDIEERRKGLATDALELMSQYCKKALGFNQLYANVSSSNLSSISLFEKAGFRKIGVKEKWNRTSEGWSSEILYQKLL